MTRRSPEEVHATLIAAGWPAGGADMMTAIAGAESGYDDSELGDVELEDATWGPSYGLFQIRTLKADTGTGSNRDINRLAGSDLEQARAALVISSNATNYTPWTTYNTGAYLPFYHGAGAPPTGSTTAAYGTAPSGSGSGDGGLPWWTPWLNALGGVGGDPNLGYQAAGTGSGVVDAATQGLLTGTRHIVLEGLAIIAGLALVVGGVFLLAKPAIKGTISGAVKAAVGGL
jgi:hypothetical protein